MEANIEYDPNCLIRNDSDENEQSVVMRIYGILLMRMIMIGRSQLAMILERGLLMLHLMTTMKRTRLLMILLMHLLLKLKFINLDKEVHRGPM